MTLKTEENNTTAAGSEPTTPSKQEATSGQEEVTSGQVTSGEEAVSAGNEATSSKPSSLSNEDLAKMYQPKTRPSLAQRLKRKLTVYLNFVIFQIFHLTIRGCSSIP